ncbi:MAG: chromosome partitioning protein ParB [Prevotella sp.]|nr:chromosome partitioning protein ParB [Prevotella sp.]
MKEKRLKGGSSNPIVFHDYELFIKKFTERPKTTDECWTPPDVYDAVLRYVGTLISLEGRDILRPFYPGGDYEHADYPEGGVVIDNPPFSQFTRICRFFMERGIPFFLFGPGLTIFSCLKHGCSVVVVADQLRFDNGAMVKCNFATNLLGDTLVLSSPRLSRMLEACASQNQKVNLPSFDYPEELLAVSDLQTIARGDDEFAVSRSEACLCRNLDLHPKKGGLFGDHLLVAKANANAKDKAKAKAKAVIPIRLSEREQRIVEGLG